MVGWYLNDCSQLRVYHSVFTIPTGFDVIFALNPIHPLSIFTYIAKDSANSFEGYRHIVSLSSHIQETYIYNPHNGQLFVNIGTSQCPVIMVTSETGGPTESASHRTTATAEAGQSDLVPAFVD